MDREQEKAMWSKRKLAGLKRSILTGSKTDSYGRYIPDAPLYVVTTDKFMSGWGGAKNKVNKLVFPVKDYHEAEIVAQNARNRTDQKNVNINTERPNYDKSRYLVQLKMKHGAGNYDSWYKAGYFKAPDR